MRKTLRLAIILVGLLNTTALYAGETSLSYLETHWSKPAVEQHFLEERFDALLEIDSQLTGQFFLTNKTHYEVRYRTPQPGSLKVMGEQVYIDFPQRKRTIALSELPNVRLFLNLLIALLYGDFNTLKMHYDLQVSEASTPGMWILKLNPKHALGAFAQGVEVSGRMRGNKVDLLGIKVNLTDGDWRRFTFADTKKLQP
jgi:hypothetical protein